MIGINSSHFVLDILIATPCMFSQKQSKEKNILSHKIKQEIDLPEIGSVPSR